MKLLFQEHNFNLYEFRYFQSTDSIEVAKAGVWTYKMSRQRSGLFVCNCPGSVYHGKCWHEKMVKLLMGSEDINEPWCEWAEDYERMMKVN